jgi:hypothetical protein
MKSLFKDRETLTGSEEKVTWSEENLLITWTIHHVYKDESVDLSLIITKTQLIMMLMTLIPEYPRNWIDPLIQRENVNRQCKC